MSELVADDRACLLSDAVVLGAGGHAVDPAGGCTASFEWFARAGTE